MTSCLLECVRCGAGIDAPADESRFGCPVCHTDIQCGACAQCGNGFCLPATIVAKSTTCPDCAAEQSIASWAQRPSRLGTVRPALDRPDLYRRKVSGTVAHAVGIPWLRPGVAATMTFSPDHVYLVAPTVSGSSEIEGIDYADVDHLVFGANAPVSESLDTTLTLRAGHRELSMVTSAFEAGALERLLDPVQIRIDTARRAPRIVPTPPAQSEPVYAPQYVTAPAPMPPSWSPGPIAPRPTPAARPAGDPRWRLLGAGAVIVVAVIALAAWMTGGSSSHDAAGTTSSTSSSSSGATDGNGGEWDSRPGSTPGEARPSRPLATPALVAGPDGSQQRVSCPAGYDIPNADGWASHAGRGTDKTSCQFARNVGAAYWQMGPPSPQPRRVVAQGAVDCELGGDRCEGNLFVMNCLVVAKQDWITCQGGSNAVVYLFGE